MAPPKRLELLDERIDARANAMREAHPSWPCRAGCADCCRSLARLPELRPAEWDRLRPAIEALPADVRALVETRANDAPEGPGVVCPLLGEDDRCRVYEARPIACRTYGFYTERDAGLHCAKVTEATKDLEVVWGNGVAINDDLRVLGEARSLRDWLSQGSNPSPPRDTASNAPRS